MRYGIFYFTFSFFTLCLLPGRIPGCCWSYLCSRSNYQHSQETEENSRSSFNCCRCNVYTVVGVHIKRLKTTFYSKFWFLTSFFQITSLQVNREKLFIGNLSLFPCLCVSMLFEIFVGIKIKIESRLYYIDICDVDSSLLLWG